MAFRDERRFDVVLAEGTVPGQKDGAGFLRHLGSFVDHEGMIFCTTHSPTSLLAETCRRMVKPIFATRFGDFAEELKQLTTFFTPDLDSLGGMSRLYEDWVLDTVLHPWKREVVFTVTDAIRALDADFDVVGTSPRFAQDWRWYKAVPGDAKGVNGQVVDEYDKWSAYFLDYRVEPGPALGFCSKTLEDKCAAIFELDIGIWEADDVGRLPEFFDALEDVAALIGQDLAATAASIRDYIFAMRGLIAGDMQADFGTFRTWFGRGMQYVSFIRR